MTKFAPQTPHFTRMYMALPSSQPPFPNTTHRVPPTLQQLPAAPQQLPAAPQQLPTAPQQLSSPPHQEPLAPHDIPSTSSTGHQTSCSFLRKRCPVSECPERIAPSMWRSHMSLHAQGLFPGGVPQTWLFEQDLFICPHCSQLVANSRVASHSRQCKVPPPISSAQNDDTQSAPAFVPDLPTFAEVCQLRCPTLRFVPKKARPSFARALSSTLRSVLDENSEEA